MHRQGQTNRDPRHLSILTNQNKERQKQVGESVLHHELQQERQAKQQGGNLNAAENGE